MSGYYCNEDQRCTAVFTSEQRDHWVVGLASFAENGIINQDESYLDGDNPYLATILNALRYSPGVVSEQYIAIKIGVSPHDYWFDTGKLEVKGRIPVKDRHALISRDWQKSHTDNKLFRETLLTNVSTGEQRTLDGDLFMEWISENTYICEQQIKSKKEAADMRVVGLYDLEKDEWKYRVDVESGFYKVHPSYFIEMSDEGKTFVRCMKTGEIHGLMSKILFLQGTSHDDEYIYTLDKQGGKLYRHEIATKTETELAYKTEATSKYTPTLSGNELLVHCRDNNSLQCYDLRTMQKTFDIALPFINLINGANRLIHFHRIGDVISFVRREQGEFKKPRASFGVRYFFDPNRVESNDFQVEALKVKHERTAPRTGKLHDYRMYFIRDPSFSEIYRQMFAYCVSICNEYGYSILQDGDPYDDSWSGVLIVDLASLQLSGIQKRKIEKLMHFIKTKLKGEITAGLDASVPVQFQLLL